jgi:tetratricopeptide (TPR) repeat protein
MQKKYTSYLCCLAVFILLSACSSALVKEPELLVTPEPVISVPVLLPEDQSLYDQGIEAISAKDFDTATPIFKGLVLAYPKLAGAYVNLALIEGQKDNSSEALAYYEKALDVNSENIDALIQLANHYQSKGDFLKTKGLLLRALDIEAGHTMVNYNLGVLFELYLQDYDRAIDHYKVYVATSGSEDVKTVERWIKMLERK